MYMMFLSLVLMSFCGVGAAQALTAKQAQSYLGNYIRAGYFYDWSQHRQQGKALFMDNQTIDADTLEALETYFMTYGKDLVAVSLTSCRLTDMDMATVIHRLPSQVTYLDVAYNPKLSDETASLMIDQAGRLQNLRHLNVRRADISEALQKRLIDALPNAYVFF
jgi:hypothetical protein